MRVGWIGFHMEGIDALKTLLEQNIQIAAVITLQEEQRAKRSGGIDYTALCNKYDIPLYKVTNINSEESIDILKQFNLDIVFVLGWSQIIKDEVLRIPHLGMVGAHASPLPHNRGSAPINWALIKGENETGNTLMRLSPGVDTGNIIDQRHFQITMHDTCKTLYEKVAKTNRDMIVSLFPELNRGNLPSTPQPTDINEDILPRRRPQDGLVDWSNSSLEIYNFIRALTRPYPGAFSFLNNEKWYIWHSALLPEQFDIPDAQPGVILGPVFSPVQDACGLMIKCGSSALLLLEIENENGDILKGERLSATKWQGLNLSNEK